MTLYAKLRTLGGENIKRILKEANIEPEIYYFSNVAMIRDLLEDYDGPVNTRAIIHYLNKDVDAEFNRLATIEFPSSRTSQSHEDRYKRYMNRKADEEFDTVQNFSRYLFLLSLPSFSELFDYFAFNFPAFFDTDKKVDCQKNSLSLSLP